MKLKVAVIMYGQTLSGGGGAERRFARAIEYMINHNIFSDVYIFTNKEFAESIYSITNNNIKDNMVIFENENVIDFNKWVLNKLKEYSIQVVHFPLFQAVLLPTYLLINPRKYKIITTVALAFFSTGQPIKKSTLIAAKLLFKKSRLIDSLYEGFLNSKWGEKYKNKVRITPCSFTDLGRFHPKKKEKTIIFCGRLIKEKNPLLVIEAANIISKDILRNWKIYIIGDGPLKDEVHKLIKKYNLGEFIIPMSTINVEKYVNKSSVFLSLQEKENYPSQSLIEAMAAANVIIATDVGETRKLVNEENGILLKEKSSVELARVITELVKNQEYIDQLAVKSRAKVLNECKVETFVNYLLKIWREA